MEQPSTTEDILELIPKDNLSQEQKDRGLDVLAEKLPIYKFSREPIHLDDIDWKKHKTIAIWRENDTVIHVCDGLGMKFVSKERSFSFDLCHVGERYALQCAIYGKTDAAIAETATFFWCLKHPGQAYATLDVKYHFNFWSGDRNDNFDFAAIEPEQLAHIMDSNPTRRLALRSGAWSPEQSITFATRPYPVHLSTSNAFALQDGGTAFVDALENRQTSFGALDFLGGGMPLSRSAAPT